MSTTLDFSDLPVLLPSNQEVDCWDLSKIPLSSLTSTTSNPASFFKKLEVNKNQNINSFLENELRNLQSSDETQTSYNSDWTNEVQSLHYDLISFYRRFHQQHRGRVFSSDDFLACSVDIFNFLAQDERVNKMKLVRFKYIYRSIQFYNCVVLSDYIREIIGLALTALKFVTWSINKWSWSLKIALYYKIFDRGRYIKL